MEKLITPARQLNCFHCGNDLPQQLFITDDKSFCCQGCQSVYQILKDNKLDNYYAYNDQPGQTHNTQDLHLAYLDEPAIINKLIDYQDEHFTLVTFYVPAIHCSSCIWLLEHLYKLNPAICSSQTDFLKKQVNIRFKNAELSLKGLIELLISIGYEPKISLQDIVKEQRPAVARELVRKIAVAGFCFGNVMLLSFPDYFGLSEVEKEFRWVFGGLNLAFALPVLFYCARDYFISAWVNLKNGRVNLDFPLALGIAVMFIRSYYEILSGTGPGFVDTLCSLVFFILIGRWMQERTYYHLSFERDYRSYFPVAVTTLQEELEKPVALGDLKVGDRILIRNNEIIPADAILLNGDGLVDFSFVTGESAPVKKVLGEVIYAGGRQMGEAIALEVIKPVSQSYLTRLWNNEAFKAKKEDALTFTDKISRYFSIVLISIAISSALYWFLMDDSYKAWASFTATLIIACPCALALSSPFTLSAVLSIFDKNKFYLKSTAIVEQLARINTIIFDKTGTLTAPKAARITFHGDLSIYERKMLASLSRNSNHPLSRELLKWLQTDSYFNISNYKEFVGKGISAIIEGQEIRIGSAAFIADKCSVAKENVSGTHILIGDRYAGFFRAEQQWRRDMGRMVGNLSDGVKIHLLSGDNDGDREALAPIFQTENMHFNQSPQQKLNYVKKLQHDDKTVMMIGDGLNDAGALKQSDLGIAVTDNINNFSPACDAILDGEAFGKLPQFIKQAKDGVKVIHISFAISLLYNFVGLSFAVQGILSPLFAAILMPLSTATIISFTSIATRVFARKNKLL
jgi:Cu+-exporting ATPase